MRSYCCELIGLVWESTPTFAAALPRDRHERRRNSKRLANPSRRTCALREKHGNFVFFLFFFGKISCLWCGLRCSRLRPRGGCTWPVPIHRPWAEDAKKLSWAATLAPRGPRRGSGSPSSIAGTLSSRASSARPSPRGSPSATGKSRDVDAMSESDTRKHPKHSADVVRE